MARKKREANEGQGSPKKRKKQKGSKKKTGTPRKRKSSVGEDGNKKKAHEKQKKVKKAVDKRHGEIMTDLITRLTVSVMFISPMLMEHHTCVRSISEIGVAKLMGRIDIGDPTSHGFHVTNCVIGEFYDSPEAQALWDEGRAKEITADMIKKIKIIDGSHRVEGCQRLIKGENVPEDMVIPVLVLAPGMTFAQKQLYAHSNHTHHTY
jgi:hypothetical protein